VYAREVKGRTLTLGVSGMLWQASVVLYDQETKSLWSHLLGVAKAGPLRGTRLEPIPSIITTWQEWLGAHPRTTVGFLPRSAWRYNRAILTLDRQKYVIGLRRGKHARAWSLSHLARRDDPCLNETWQGVPLVVVLDRKSFSLRIFDRRVGEQTLEFSWRDDSWEDLQTGTRWHPLTGQGLEGPLKGKRLRPLEGIFSYTRAWLDFHPQSELWPAGWRPGR